MPRARTSGSKKKLQDVASSPPALVGTLEKGKEEANEQKKRKFESPKSIVFDLDHKEKVDGVLDADKHDDNDDTSSQSTIKQLDNTDIEDLEFLFPSPWNSLQNVLE